MQIGGTAHDLGLVRPGRGQITLSHEQTYFGT
jgi:hypothetical protein